MKGVEAPFQLLVSVVAMVMVLGLAYMVLQNATREDCNNKWEIQLRNIATALSTVIQGSAPTRMNISFDFRCGEATQYHLALVKETNPDICIRVCHQSGASGGCGILKLSVKDARGRNVSRVLSCVEGMAGYVNFGLSGSCGSGGTNITNTILVSNSSDEGYELSPPFGTLVIEKRLSSGEPVLICRVR